MKKILPLPPKKILSFIFFLLGFWVLCLGLCLGISDEGRELETTEGEPCSWILYSPSLPGWARKSEHRLGNQNTGGRPHHLASVCALSHQPDLLLGEQASYIWCCSWAIKDHCNHLPGKPACPSQVLLKLVSLFLTQNKGVILVITGECVALWNWHPCYYQITANLSLVMKWQMHFATPDLKVWAVTYASKEMFP